MNYSNIHVGKNDQQLTNTIEQRSKTTQEDDLQLVVQWYQLNLLSASDLTQITNQNKCLPDR